MINFEHPEALRKMIVAEIRVNSTQRSFGGASMARMGSTIAEHMMQMLRERIEVLKLMQAVGAATSDRREELVDLHKFLDKLRAMSLSMPKHVNLEASGRSSTECAK
jgi:hypothetical protein